MRQREETIKIWTDMWLGNDTMPMDAIFTEDVVYTPVTFQKAALQKAEARRERAFPNPVEFRFLQRNNTAF